MWPKLQCDYYIELILKLLSEMHLLLSAEAYKMEDCLSRKSNVESAVKTLQALLLTYKLDKLIPDDYVNLYSPLIDLRSLLSSIDQRMILNERDILCNEIANYIETIRRICNKIIEKCD
jgi:hypothetical protein